MIKNWNEMTISQYKKIVGIPKDDDWVWNFIAVIENTTAEDILSRPIAETVRLSYDANRFLDKSPKTSRLKWDYVINGNKYHLSANPNDITTAMYIDFTNALKNIPDNLSALIAIFLHPEGKKYNEGYDIKKVEMEFEKYMGIEDALAVCHFFSVLFQYYLRIALRRSKKALKQIRRKGTPELKAEAEKAERMVKTYQSLLKEYRAING
jgi:hypothetical protein